MQVTSGTVTYEHFNSTRLTSPASCTEPVALLSSLISDLTFVDEARERSVTETHISESATTLPTSPNSYSSPNFKRTISFRMVLFSCLNSPALVSISFRLWMFSLWCWCSQKLCYWIPLTHTFLFFGACLNTAYSRLSVIHQSPSMPPTMMSAMGELSIQENPKMSKSATGNPLSPQASVPSPQVLFSFFSSLITSFAASVRDFLVTRPKYSFPL